MSYDEYPELWEEAVETAEECSNCNIRDLEIPKGESKYYEFCKEHHWKFYRKYMIRRQKGEKGKDDFTAEDLAEGLSEQLGKEVDVARTNYESESLDGLVFEIMEKIDEEHGLSSLSQTKIQHLHTIAKEKPSKVEPVGEQLINKLLKADSSHWGFGNVALDEVPEILGIICIENTEFKKEIFRLIESENHKLKVAGIRALEEVAQKKPEVLFDTIKRKKVHSGLISRIFGSTEKKDISAFSLVAEEIYYESSVERNAEIEESRMRSEVIAFMRELSEEYPGKIAPYVEEVADFDKGVEGSFDSIITLAFVGREHPDKVEKFRDQVSSYLGEVSEGVDGQKRTLSGAASLFFLLTELDQNKFSNEELNQEVRSLIDASKYKEPIRIDIIKGLGYIGTKDDIELIEYFKTDYSSREFKNTVEKAVKMIKNRE